MPEVKPMPPFADFFSFAFRYKWPLIAMTLLGALVGLAVFSVTDARYESTVILMPSQFDDDPLGLPGSAGALGGLAAIAGIDVAGGSSQETALAILESRTFLSRFIEEREIVDDLLSFAGKRAEGDAALYLAYDVFVEDVLVVNSDSVSGVVELAVLWTDPTTAADWANDLVERLNEFTRRRAIARSEQSISYLQTELQRASIAGLDEAIARLIESEIRTIMLASVNLEYSFVIVDAAVPAPVGKPKTPRLGLNLLLGVVLGGALGLLFVYFNHLRAYYKEH